MKVKEIIKKLSKLPQDLEVYTDFGVDAYVGGDALPITYVDEVVVTLVDPEVADGEKHAVLLSAYWRPGQRESWPGQKQKKK